MREVTLRVRHHGAPESDISAEFPEVTLRSVSSLTGSATERKRIVEFTGPAEDIAEFLDAFGQAASVLAAEPFSPLTNDRVFVGITYDSSRWDSIAQQLTDIGVHYRVGTDIQNGWEYWTLYLDAGDNLAAIVDTLEQAGNTTELVRDVSLDEVEGRQHLALSRMLDDLTDRQSGVLAAAVASGYYDSGTHVTVEDVSERVGLARTTTWEHLSRAEEKIMAEVGEFLGTHGI